MNIDKMRVNGGRCPPLLVGGLLIACFMLICNWWNVSSANIELLSQIEELTVQIKKSVDERDQCVTKRNDIEMKYKYSDENLAKLHVKLTGVEESLAMCKGELESLKKLEETRNATLAALRLERDTLNAQLETKKDENKKLEDDLNKKKEDLDKLKMTMNSPTKTKTPQIPIAQLLAKTKPTNATNTNIEENKLNNEIDPDKEDLLDNKNKGKFEKGDEVENNNAAEVT